MQPSNFWNLRKLQASIISWPKSYGIVTNIQLCYHPHNPKDLVESKGGRSNETHQGPMPRQKLLTGIIAVHTCEVVWENDACTYSTYNRQTIFQLRWFQARKVLWTGSEHYSIHCRLFQKPGRSVFFFLNAACKTVRHRLLLLKLAKRVGTPVSLGYSSP